MAKGGGESSATVARWKRTPGHRAIMLGARLKVMGVGRGRGDDWHRTADFGGTVTRTMAI